MTTESLITKLRDVWAGSPWYGRSVRELLLRVDYDSPQIRQIILHMIAWRRFALDKINGVNAEIVMDSEIDWPQQEQLSITESIDWLEANISQITAALADRDDDWLQSSVIGENYDYKFLINGIIQHDIYHIGQIVLLLKHGL